MIQYEKRLSLVDFDENFEELSFHWINDERIMRLIDAKPIDRKTQQTNLLSIRLRTDYYIYGVSIDDNSVGVAGIKNASEDDGELFCYIGDFLYVGKGWGNILIQEIISKAKELHLKKLYLKVLKNNERAIKSYKKNGFIESSDDNKFSYMYYVLK